MPAKRDFIFIDEAGDPAQETPYYIQGLLHVTDKSLKKLNIHLGAFRYFGNIRNELKSTRINKIQKGQFLRILQESISDDFFISASGVYIDKEKYNGKYLKKETDPTKFRHLMIRRLLECHFEKYKAQTKEIEVVVDRFHSNEEKEQQMKNYLRTLSSMKFLPNFLHIIQADSRYLELLQIADWVAGSIKEKKFTHPERKEYDYLFKYINTKEILN